MPKKKENTLIFIAHHENERNELKKLLTHLEVLKSGNALSIWHKSLISAGENHQKSYNDHLKKANIVLLLITADFITSEEFQNLKTKLSNQPKTKIVLILVKPALWEEDVYLKNLQVLPKSKQAISASSTANTEENYVNIALEIRHVINSESQKSIMQDNQKEIKTSELNDLNSLESKAKDNKSKPEKKQKKGWLRWVLLGIIGTAAVIAGVYTNFPQEQEVDPKSNDKQAETKEEDILSHLALPFASNDSVLNVLIIRFEDKIAKKEATCIGESIETNLIHLRKKLPLNPIYADTIASPKRPEVAKKIQEKYNADVLIYGLVNQVQENCLGANICFRHIIADTVMANIEVPEAINKVKDDLQYLQISPFEIEQGKLSVNEKSMEAWLASLIALKADDEEDAFAQIEKMVDVDNTNLTKEELTEQYYQRGVAYYDLGNYDLSIKDFTKAIELSPKYAIAYNGRGVSYRELGNNDLSIKDYTKAIELSPKYATAYNSRGVSYKELGNNELAIKDYTKAIKLSPKYTIAYNNRGVSYRELGSDELAIGDYEKAIELSPKYATAYNNRGVSYKELGNNELAIKDYTKAIKLSPKYVMAHNNRGVSYRELGNNELAIKDFTKAIKLNPEYAKPYINRGISYMGLGNYESSIKDFTRAIELNTDNTSIYGGRGSSYYNLGNYDLSIKDYTKAIELNPKNASAYNNRGISYMYLGNYDLSIKDYTKSIELDPEDSYTKLNLIISKLLKFISDIF